MEQCLSDLYDGLSKKALHPDKPNEISIGDLRLLVHIPNEHIPCQRGNILFVGGEGQFGRETEGGAIEEVEYIG